MRDFSVSIVRETAGSAAEAVSLIGEHGDYPVNELGQVEYPRKRFFDEAVAAMRAAGRVVPVFKTHARLQRERGLATFALQS